MGPSAAAATSGASDAVETSFADWADDAVGWSGVAPLPAASADVSAAEVD